MIIVIIIIGRLDTVISSTQYGMVLGIGEWVLHIFQTYWFELVVKNIRYNRWSLSGSTTLHHMKYHYVFDQIIYYYYHHYYISSILFIKIMNRRMGYGSMGNYIISMIM